MYVYCILILILLFKQTCHFLKIFFPIFSSYNKLVYLIELNEVCPGQGRVLRAYCEQTQEAEGVHPAPLVGVGEQQRPEAPGREDGEGRNVLGGGRGGKVIHTYALYQRN